METIKTEVETYFEMLEHNCPGSRHVFCTQSADEFYEAVEVTIENAIQHMESGARFKQNCDERALTHDMVGYLGGGGVHVQNEAYCNGHVDITIVHPNRTAWKVLGECKLYRGPAHHIDGCSQLLGRYSTGRLPKGFCLEFVHQAGIRDKIQGIREEMDRIHPLKQKGESLNHHMRWSFKTIHVHLSGEDFAILHAGCNLCINSYSS